MFTMATRRTFLVSSLLALTLAMSAPTTAMADDEGCAGATLRPHLDRLDGWSVATFRVVPSGGVQIVMDLEDGGRTLLIAMTVSDAGMNTFQMTRGKQGDSSLEPEVTERLTAMYQAIGEDSKVLACDILKGEAPPPDQVYAELEALFRSLYEFSDSKTGKGGVSVTLLVVVAAVVLVLAGIVLARVRRRRTPNLPQHPPSDSDTSASDDQEIATADAERSQDDPPEDETARTPPEPPTDA